MKLRELTLTENPGQVPNPAQQQQTAQGAKVAVGTMGAKGGSGAMMAKGLDKVAQGGALPANLAKQIAPFAKNLETILGDTAMRQKFMMLIKQAEKSAQAGVADVKKEADVDEADSVMQLAKLVSGASAQQQNQASDFANEMRALAGIKTETATAGATSTSSGNIASVANPSMAYGHRAKDSKGLPKAPQKKNKDGTAKNALDIDNGLMGGKTIKR